MSKIRDFTTSYNQKNIVGPVSQVGGVPSGAIIESGSNANGNYVKYADGTLECWFDAKFVYGASAYMTYTWTLPVASGSGRFIALSGTQLFFGASRYNKAVPSGTSGVGPVTTVSLRLWATGSDSFSPGDITEGTIPMWFKGRWF